MKGKSITYTTPIFPLLITVLILCVGCAGSSNPTQPALSQNSTNASGGVAENRYFWGLWDVYIPEDRSNVEMIPVRTGSMHLNAVGLLENYPCTDCLRITNLVTYPDNRLSVDLTLIHPFPGMPKLTGFDVRGIFITGADYYFPACDRWIAMGDEFPRLLLPYGYTSLFNPWEYDNTLPGPDIFKYIPGHYATGGVLESTLNGYISFRREAPRRMFESGGSETRTVWLSVPDGPLRFGYAVDCCWMQVSGQVTDPFTDFPPEANCLEAYRVDVQLGSDLQPIPGAIQPVEVQVFDYQGLDTIDWVILEAPDLFTGEIALEYFEDVGTNTHLFTGAVTNEFGAPVGEYPLLVRVIDTEQDQNLGQIDAWYLYTVEVGARDGWVRTWGGDAYILGVRDYAEAVDCDADGNIYVTGHFRKTVDLDPGEGVEIHSATKGAIFLTKFNTDGDFIWTRVWDGMGVDRGEDVTVDNDGNILLIGDYDGLIDLDPGPLTDAREGHKFLLKMDPDGNYLYGLTWEPNIGTCVTDGYNNYYIIGGICGQMDMDPGEGEDLRWAMGECDFCLIKISPEGEYIWSRTWGSATSSYYYSDRLYSVVADSEGHAYVSGYVFEAGDFDPGSAVVEGGPGYFLSKFAPTGKFLGVNVWGASINYLALDSEDNLCIAGAIGSDIVVDLDAGPGVDEIHGPSDFLAMYTSSGDYIWGRSFDPLGVMRISGLTIAPTNEIYLSGHFYWNMVDFDPTDNTDYHASIGENDVFITKYLTTGEYQWTRTWGSEYDYEKSNDIAGDSEGNAYIAGSFRDPVDFDPGPGIEIIEAHGGGDAYVIKIPPDGNW